jgi:hypothetical protein
MPYGPARAPGSRRDSRPADNQLATPARGSGGRAPFRSTDGAAARCLSLIQEDAPEEIVAAIKQWWPGT